jgi:hypothetical protein
MQSFLIEVDEIRAGEIIANQHLITVKENTNISVCANLMLDSSIVPY